MKYQTQTPYIAAYVILRKDEKVAFVLRENTSWMNDFYGLPSGKVEDKESFVSAAIREGKEEVGVDIKRDDLVHVHTVHRLSPDNGMQWVDVYFDVTRWSGEVVNAEPHMHSELAWLDPTDLPDNVIPPVADALKAIGEGKTYSEFGY